MIPGMDGSSRTAKLCLASEAKGRRIIAIDAHTVDGRLTDDNRTKVTAETDSDKEQEANPFLEIRQAVIAAGNKNNHTLEQSQPSEQQKSDPDTARTNTPTSALLNELEVKSTEKTFAKHLANLIDSEIERRMAVRIQAIKKPSNKNTSAKKTSPKPRKIAKTSRKIKEKAARKSASKRPSTAKRTKPK